jgi:hypothetical protein
MYTNKILNKFNMTEAEGVSKPASREESDNHKDINSKDPYHEAVCSLMYLEVQHFCVRKRYLDDCFGMEHIDR